MAGMNFKDALDMSFRATKYYIDQEINKKADKVSEYELYAMLGRVFPELFNTLGYVDENNNIILKDGFANGTYAIKYENENGTHTDIGSFNVSNKGV